MKIFKKLLLTIFILFLTFTISLSGNFAYANSNLNMYLGGFTAGFTVNSKGVTVIGLTEVFTEDGLCSPAKTAGIIKGDVILNLNGTEIHTASDVYTVLKKYKSGYIVTQIERNGNIIIKDVFPEKDMTGEYKLGVFLRDGLTGLGTVTYVLEDGTFASLGHPVTDDSGKVISVVGGNAYNVNVIGVNKAERGNPGELKGLFISKTPTGKITANTAVGLFGKFNNFNCKNYQKTEVGTAKIGYAEIYSTVDGEKVEKYSIEILKTDMRNTVTKNLVIKVTDKNLLSYTGGILQGMSGSPIVQNGKIVGAVTHVFVNDATRGFGISIQNMLAG